MSKELGPARALAASARLANLPSVLCNVWLGTAIAMALGTLPAWPASLLVMLAGTLLYLAGNFLNDWHDRAWDARHRPERALPRGLFRPACYLRLAVGLALAGLAAAILAHPRSGFVAAGIFVCVTLYTRYHKRAKWPILPMALCRALLPVMAFLSITGESHPALIAAAGALLCHTLGISLTARHEGRGPVVPGCAWLCFPAAALLMLQAYRLIAFPMPALSLAALLPYTLWITLSLTSWRGRFLALLPVKNSVSGLLAGFPLLDAVLLFPLALGQPQAGTVSAVSLCLPPAAFLAGLVLQRLAPAT